MADGSSARYQGRVYDSILIKAGALSVKLGGTAEVFKAFVPLSGTKAFFVSAQVLKAVLWEAAFQRRNHL